MGGVGQWLLCKVSCSLYVAHREGPKGAETIQIVAPKLKDLINSESKIKKKRLQNDLDLVWSY
jgi:hypothetical protein